MKTKPHLPIVASLLGITILCLTGVIRQSDDKRFNSSQWKAEGANLDALKPGSRLEMLNDLTNNHLHKGMHIKEVLELLGQADMQLDMEDRGGSQNHGPNYVYWLTNSHSRWKDFGTWLRYQKKAPCLVVEYGKTGDKLIDIRIE